MGSFEYTVTTSAAPDVTLRYLADLENLVEYVEEVDQVTREGDRWNVTIHRSLIPDMVLDYSVTSDAGSVVAQGTHSSIDCVDAWEVAATPEGSEVRYHGSYELKGPARLTGPLSQLAGSWRAKGIGKRLKSCLDALPDAAAPPAPPAT